MSESEVTHRAFWGAHLFATEDDAGMDHHWWIHETDDGRALACAEVIHYDDGERHYVDEGDIHLPLDVQEAITETMGVENIYHVGDFR